MERYVIRNGDEYYHGDPDGQFGMYPKDALTTYFNSRDDAWNNFNELMNQDCDDEYYRSNEGIYQVGDNKTLELYATIDLVTT